MVPVAMVLTIYSFFYITLPTDVRITGEEFSRSRPIVTQKLVTQRTNEDAFVGDDEWRFIKVKLFGLIPIRKIKVDILPFERVIVGGQLLGFHAEIADDERSLTGLGTLTYVNPENVNLESMGHRMNDYETKKSVDGIGGKIYINSVIGIERSEGKKVGTYRSSIRNAGVSSEGDIHSSNSFGVYGCLSSGSKLSKAGELPLSSRYNVVPGRAKLRTTLDGEVRDFDIEIVKTRFQKKPSSKSMIVRIVDKELLEKTGGIIHGMSGSPIIQKGRVVGALTHVVLGDPSKGYGIYIDFMTTQ